MPDEILDLLDPMTAMWCRMYPVQMVMLPTGEPCDIPDCACEGRNEKVIKQIIDPALN